MGSFLAEIQDIQAMLNMQKPNKNLEVDFAEGKESNLAKASVSGLLANQKASSGKTVANKTDTNTTDTSTGTTTDAEGFNITPGTYLGLSAGGAALSTGAGIFDTDRDARHASRQLESQFVQDSILAAERGEFVKEQNELNFEQAKELGQMAQNQRLEFQEKQFDNSMELLAQQTGFRIDQLKTNTQLANDVRQVNELERNMASVRRVSAQAVDSDVQQFFRDPVSGASI